MKRSFPVAVVMTLILVLVLSMTVTASSTTKNLVSNFTLVNTTTEDAQGLISYIKEDGSEWTGSGYTDFGPGMSHELVAGGQLVVRQYADTLEAGRGSVVVSANVPLGAVVQMRLAPGDTSLPTAGAYLAFNGGSSRFYLPLVQAKSTTSTGLANTQIMVQNVDDTAIDATIDLTADPSCTTCTPTTHSVVITDLAVGATYFYDLADDAALTNWTGSAVVNAGVDKVAVVVNSFNGANGLRTYNGFAEEQIGPAWGIPLFASKLSNGLNTSVAVQNLSTTALAIGDLDLDCGEFTMSNTVAIPQYGSFSFNPVNDIPAVFPTNWQGACTIDAGTNDVVAFVIMRRIGGSNGDQAAYEALNLNTVASKLYVPLAAKLLPNGFATSIVVQNLSDTAVTFDAHWKVSAAECLAATTDCVDYDEVGLVIPANGNYTWNLRMSTGGFPGMAAGWQGSLEIVPVAGSAPIAGYTVLSNLVNSPGDNYRAHVLLVEEVPNNGIDY